MEVLLYDIEQGGVEEAIVDQAVRQGLPIPNKILNAPSLPVGMEFYYHAFTDLSTCRNIGMAEGPIPWTAINTYSIRHEVGGDDYDYFVVLIQAVDALYLRHRDNTRKREESKAKRKR